MRPSGELFRACSITPGNDLGFDIILDAQKIMQNIELLERFIRICR